AVVVDDLQALDERGGGHARERAAQGERRAERRDRGEHARWIEALHRRELLWTGDERSRSQPDEAATIRRPASIWRESVRTRVRDPPLDFFVCMTDNELKMSLPAYPRATRAAGKQTRRALLDAAGSLFAERGLAGVSAAEIARAAGAFPSQVTYYFGSKE